MVNHFIGWVSIGASIIQLIRFVLAILAANSNEATIAMLFLIAGVLCAYGLLILDA